MDGSPPDSSVRGIFQARIFERVALSFCRESWWLRDRIPRKRYLRNVYKHILVTKWPFWTEFNTLDTTLFQRPCLQAVVNKNRYPKRVSRSFSHLLPLSRQGPDVLHHELPLKVPEWGLASARFRLPWSRMDFRAISEQRIRSLAQLLTVAQPASLVFKQSCIFRAASNLLFN